MAGGHGGRREGAGRKPKDRSGQERFEDAEAYLLAVVRGEAIPDSVRVTAAKALIVYQRAKQRTPVKSPPPSQLRRKAEADLERSTISEFERKAEEIRQKYRRCKP